MLQSNFKVVTTSSSHRCSFCGSHLFRAEAFNHARGIVTTSNMFHYIMLSEENRSISLTFLIPYGNSFLEKQDNRLTNFPLFRNLLIKRFKKENDWQYGIVLWTRISVFFCVKVNICQHFGPRNSRFLARIHVRNICDKCILLYFCVIRPTCLSQIAIHACELRRYTFKRQVDQPS